MAAASAPPAPHPSIGAAEGGLPPRLPSPQGSAGPRTARAPLLRTSPHSSRPLPSPPRLTSGRGGPAVGSAPRERGGRCLLRLRHPRLRRLKAQPPAPGGGGSRPREKKRPGPSPAPPLRRGPSLSAGPAASGRRSPRQAPASLLPGLPRRRRPQAPLPRPGCACAAAPLPIRVPPCGVAGR